jgi:radical SAM protein (TIGR01212 family)
MKKPYNDLNGFLRGHFGCRVHKIAVDAGLTCPNRDGSAGSGGCIFCNSRGSGTGAHAAGLSVTAQLEKGKAAVSKRFKAKKFIAYFQSFSNTYAPLPHLNALYTEALSVPDVVGLSIGTRPDCVDEAVLGLLGNLAGKAMVWMEYGLQSAHDETLRRIGRGHDVRCFEKAVALTRGRGIRICAHVILGLPGETRSHMMATADRLARMGIDGVKLHLLYVVRGTGLEREFRSGNYRCLEQEEYVALVCDFIERLPPEMVVQRLTGDPHPNELVAPAWSLRKRETLERIADLFRERGTSQGVRLGRPPTAP